MIGDLLGMRLRDHRFGSNAAFEEPFRSQVWPSSSGTSGDHSAGGRTGGRKRWWWVRH